MTTVEKPKRIDLAGIADRLAYITVRVNHYDNEAAHEAEDQLWTDVLEGIAAQRFELPEVAAQMALQSRDIEFNRYYI